MSGRPISSSPRPWVLDELDRLRSENETLRQMHAELMRRNEILTATFERVQRATRSRTRVMDEMAGERDALRRWQQEACEFLSDVGPFPRNSDIAAAEDLLRRAGKEVQ